MLPAILRVPKQWNLTQILDFFTLKLLVPSHHI
uniref:Uncharacterized protein n=1 Tax=Amphimedon queenslandica TaxID=400682 RepID=A0A1X7VDS8_AMPQE